MRLALAALAILALAAAVRLRADARRFAEWDALDADDSEIVGPDPRTVWVGVPPAFQTYTLTTRCTCGNSVWQACAIHAQSWN